MNTSKRQELVRQLELLGALYPHWRFGQLASNVADLTGTPLVECTDEQMEAAARDHVAHRTQVLQMPESRLAEVADGMAERRPLLAALEECERIYPAERLGESLASVAAGAGVNVYDAEDEEMLAAIRARFRPPRLVSPAGPD